MVTAIQLREFVERLCEEEVYDPTEGLWLFRSGGACGRCTDAAVKVVHAWGGRVVGYFSSNTTSALVGHGNCEGHDFALIEGRFVVDYLAFRVARMIDRPVFDLSDVHEQSLVRMDYGGAGNWVELATESGIQSGKKPS